MSCCLVLTSEVDSVESSVSIESSNYAMSDSSDQSMSNTSDKSMSNTSNQSMSNTSDKSMSNTSHNSVSDSMSNAAGGEDAADPVGVGAVQAAGVVGDGGHRGSKGLGLGHAPVLTLQRL